MAGPCDELVEEGSEIPLLNSHGGSHRTLPAQALRLFPSSRSISDLAVKLSDTGVTKRSSMKRISSESGTRGCLMSVRFGDRVTWHLVNRATSEHVKTIVVTMQQMDDAVAAREQQLDQERKLDRMSLSAAHNLHLVSASSLVSNVVDATRNTCKRVLESGYSVEHVLDGILQVLALILIALLIVGLHVCEVAWHFLWPHTLDPCETDDYLHYLPGPNDSKRSQNGETPALAKDEDDNVFV